MKIKQKYRLIEMSCDLTTIYTSPQKIEAIKPIVKDVYELEKNYNYLVRKLQEKHKSKHQLTKQHLKEYAKKNGKFDYSTGKINKINITNINLVSLK